MINVAKESFSRQGFMETIGAKIVYFDAGILKIDCHLNESLSQQNGFFHAGVITSIADVASGYAALSMMPDGSDVLTVEFKTNFLRAANIDAIRATGKVIKSGRTLTFCESIVTDIDEKIIYATMQATVMCLNKNK